MTKIWLDTTLFNLRYPILAKLVGGLLILFLLLGAITEVYASVLYNSGKLYWNSIISVGFSVAGIIFIIKILRKWSYFIGWDEHVIEYFLPENIKRHKIAISEVKEIVVGLTEVSILTEQGFTTLKLRKFAYKDLTLIKENFEKLKLSVEGLFGLD